MAIWRGWAGRLGWSSEAFPTGRQLPGRESTLEGDPPYPKGARKRRPSARTAPGCSRRAPPRSRSRGGQPGRRTGPPEDSGRSGTELLESPLALLAPSLAAAPRKAPGMCQRRGQPRRPAADPPRLKRARRTYQGGGPQRRLRPVTPQGGRGQLPTIEHGRRHC